MDNKSRKQMADAVFAELIDPELAQLIESSEDVKCDAETTKIIRNRKSKRKKQKEIEELSEGSVFKTVCQKQKEAISRIMKKQSVQTL